MSGKADASDAVTLRYVLRLPVGKLLPGFYAAKYECATFPCFPCYTDGTWTASVSPPCAASTTTYASWKGNGLLQSTFSETVPTCAPGTVQKKSTCVSAIDSIWNAPWTQLCPTLGPLAPTGGSITYASNTALDVRSNVMPADRQLLVSCTYAGFKLLARQPQVADYESFVRDYTRYFVSDVGPSGRVLTRAGGIHANGSASIAANATVPLLAPIDFAYPNAHNDLPPEMNIALFLRQKLASATDYAGSSMDRTWVASSDVAFTYGATDHRESNSSYLYIADAGISSGNVAYGSARGSIASFYCSRVLPSSFCPIEASSNDDGAALVYSTHADYYGHAILDGGVDSTTLNGVEQAAGDVMRFRRCGYAFSAHTLGSAPSAASTPVVHLPGICGALVAHQHVTDTSLVTPDLSTADTSIANVCARKIFALRDSALEYTAAYNAETALAYSGGSVTVSSNFVGSAAPTTPPECACVNATSYYQYWEVLALSLTSEASSSSCAAEGYLPCSSTSANAKCWWGACNSAVKFVSSVTTPTCTSTRCQFWPADGTQTSSLSCSCNICMNIFCLESGGAVLGSSVSQSVSCSVTGVSKPTASTDCCAAWNASCRDNEEFDGDTRIYTVSNSAYTESLAIEPTACSTTNKSYAQNVLQIRLHYSGRSDGAVGVRVQSSAIFTPATMTPPALFSEVYNPANSLSTDGYLRMNALGNATHYAFMYVQVPTAINALRELRAQWIATTPRYDFADNYPLVTSNISTLVIPPPMSAYTSPSLSPSASSRFTYVGSFASVSGSFTAAGVGESLSTAYAMMQNGLVYGGRVLVFRFQLSSGSFSCTANASPGAGALTSAGCVCDPGYVGDATACSACPAGSYCAGGLASAVACPVGTTSCAGSASVADCSAGASCTGPCTNTSFTCQANASAPCYATSASQCVCAPGYRDAGGTCALCAAGYSCVGGVMTACPTGQTSTAGASACVDATDGGGTVVSTPVVTPWYKALASLPAYVLAIVVLAVLLIVGAVVAIGVRASLRRRGLARVSKGVSDERPVVDKRQRDA